MTLFLACSHAHRDEGFALDWSRVVPGRLAAGDCAKGIHVWEPAPGGGWAVSAPYKGHSASVEDLQWSPTEATVSALASHTIRPGCTEHSSEEEGKFYHRGHAAYAEDLQWNFAKGMVRHQSGCSQPRARSPRAL